MFCTVGFLKKRPCGVSGFSLLELCLVIMISGILLIGAVQAYKAYEQRKSVQTTKEKIQTVTDAMMFFMATYGHFPCAASTSAKSGDADFGVAGDCDVPNPNAVFPDGCGNDFCVDTIDGEKIIIGSVPFRTLAEGLASAPYEKNFPIGFGDTFDNYGRRLTYVVTRKQATPFYKRKAGGAIYIENEHGHVFADKAQGDGADFILISHGANRNGAIPKEGAFPGTGCQAGMVESENCDGDGEFIDSLIYETQGAQYFDDMLIYRSWLNYFHWKASAEDEDDIYNLNIGNVGIGPNFINGAEVKSKLHVEDGNFRTDGNLKVDEICRTDDPSTCFGANIIAGDDMEDVCEDGQAAIGIAHKKPVCDDMIDYSQYDCGDGQYAIGYQYDPYSKQLELKCDAP